MRLLSATTLNILSASAFWHLRAVKSESSSWPGAVGLHRRDNTSVADNITTATASPNATGVWPFRGIDVTKPMNDAPPDEFGQGNGWSFNVAVATNIAQREGDAITANPMRLSLEAPDDAFEDANSSTDSTADYNVCAYIWWRSSWSRGEMEKLQQDKDGSCNGAISEECITELRRTLPAQNCTFGGVSNRLESCPDSVTSGGTFWADIVSITSNRSSYSLAGKWPPYSNVSDEQSTREAYDEALSGVFPVMLIYDFDDGTTQNNYTVFRCVRADRIAEGSRSPDVYGAHLRSLGVQSKSSVTLLAVVLVMAYAITFYM